MRAWLVDILAAAAAAKIRRLRYGWRVKGNDAPWLIWPAVVIQGHVAVRGAATTSWFGMICPRWITAHACLRTSERSVGQRRFRRRRLRFRYGYCRVLGWLRMTDILSAGDCKNKKRTVFADKRAAGRLEGHTADDYIPSLCGLDGRRFRGRGPGRYTCRSRS